MPLRLNNLRLPVEAPEGDLLAAAAARLGLATEDVSRWRILRKSLDARSRHALEFVYSLSVSLHDESPSVVQSRLAVDRDALVYEPEAFDDPPPGRSPLQERPVVIGSGPAGLLAAYYLAGKGYRPIVLERGTAVKERVPEIRRFDSGGPHDVENNYLFGEGGAGCFSDGKLTCRMSGPDVDWTLAAFVACGGRESIIYEHRPHLGSNKLPLICRNFRRKIEALGGEYRFQTRFEGLDVANGQLQGVETSSGRLACDTAILGIGHSARDTFRRLHAAGLPMQQKAFQLGLRIEQPQTHVNQWKYGRSEYLALLGAADYTLVARGQRDVYTFCMCAGGIVIPSVSEPERFCTNGMSNSRHDTPFANSGLMVTLEPPEFGSAHPLAGMELQSRYEAVAFELGRRQYLCPISSARDFLKQRSPGQGDAVLRSSYERGVVPAVLDSVLPTAVVDAIRRGLPIMDQRWRGRFLEDATLVGPEMRGSSPLRIERDQVTRECPGFAGVFPVGEGAGYAGGIISAAVDGLRSARELVRRYAPPG